MYMIGPFENTARFSPAWEGLGFGPHISTRAPNIAVLLNCMVLSELASAGK